MKPNCIIMNYKIKWQIQKINWLSMRFYSHLICNICAVKLKKHRCNHIPGIIDNDSLWRVRFLNAIGLMNISHEYFFKEPQRLLFLFHISLTNHSKIAPSIANWSKLHMRYSMRWIYVWRFNQLSSSVSLKLFCFARLKQYIPP